jgi:HEAT repeat protein
VSALLDEVSSPEVIGQLVHALEQGSIASSPRQLGEFLMHLRAQALSPLLRASETIAVRELQPVLRTAVGGIAQRNRGVLVNLISSDDPLVAAGAARLAGSLQVTEAATALQGLLKHAEAAVRIAAIESAVMLKASTVAGALPETLNDPDRAVRIAGARALGQLRYRPAGARFRSLLTGRDIRAADITEKIAFFEAYGEIGDPEAVALLDKLLNGKGLLGRRESAEVRAAAALALGKVATQDARRALGVAKADDDAVVRSAVNRALRDVSDARP